MVPKPGDRPGSCTWDTEPWPKVVLIPILILTIILIQILIPILILILFPILILILIPILTPIPIPPRSLGRLQLRLQPRSGVTHRGDTGNSNTT